MNGWSISFGVLALSGVSAGAYYLAWIAPWRSNLIYLSLLPLLGVLGVAWRLVRARAGLRILLIGALFLLNLAVAAVYQRAYARHHDNEFPELAAHRLAGDTATPSRTADMAGRRARLYHFLNDSASDSQILADAAQLMNNDYALSFYKPVRIQGSFNWKEDPVGDRSWNWDLHNMHYVATLARAYELTGKIAYLSKAEGLVLDWIAQNNAYLLRPVSIFSWNEHSAAFRLMNWLYFFDVWKGSPLAQAAKAETILRSLVGHAKLQSQQAFYFDNHNHGIDQDRSLMAFSMMHPEIRDSAPWLQLSLARIAKQFKFAVSPKGIHLEHSAGYHLYGMQQMQRTADFLDASGIRSPLQQELAGAIGKMAQYVPNLVKPDGMLVQLGDTAIFPITNYQEQLAPFAAQSPLIRQLGATGETALLKDSAVAFKDEGYAVVRDFNGATRNFKDSTYLFFTAGAHQGHGHRQADDLSFTLSANGRELLSDPGVYSYKDDAARQYVISTSAHNTVLVDGTSQKGWDTRLDAFSANDNLAFIRASHRNYANLEHVRRLVFVRPSLLVVIDDIRQTGGPGATALHKVEQLFHFPPELGVELAADRRCALVTPNGFPAPSFAVLKICQIGAAAPALRVAKGEQSPLQGWHSPVRASLVPAPALLARLDVKTGEFVTILELLPTSAKDNAQQARGHEFTMVKDGTRMDISWQSETGRHTLRLDLAGDSATLH